MRVQVVMRSDERTRLIDAHIGVPSVRWAVCDDCDRDGYLAPEFRSPLRFASKWLNKPLDAVLTRCIVGTPHDRWTGEPGIEPQWSKALFWHETRGADPNTRVNTRERWGHLEGLTGAWAIAHKIVTAVHHLYPAGCDICRCVQVKVPARFSALDAMTLCPTCLAAVTEARATEGFYGDGIDIALADACGVPGLSRKGFAERHGVTARSLHRQKPNVEPWHFIDKYAIFADLQAKQARADRENAVPQLMKAEI